MNDYISVREAARYLGCSPPTIDRLIAAGELPAFRPPTDLRRRLVRVADLEAVKLPRPIAGGGVAA